jgi:type I restriction enzyme S subunit
MEILLPQLRFPEFIGEWEEKKFDEIFLFSTGKNIKQNESSPEFETPCVRYGELYHMYNEVISAVINKTNLDRTELVFSQGNEILLPSAGEDPLDIGSASALTIKNVAIGRTINILRPLKMDIYSQIYASYFINEKLRKKISTLAKGVSISNVYNSDLKTLEIILPSLPEQTKIAAFLTVVDNKLTALKQKKTLLEQYKKGVMQQIFSQELRFKDDNGIDFPDWEEKKLGEVGKFISGTGFTDKEQGGKVGIPFFKVSDMNIFENKFKMIKANHYVNDEQIKRLKYKIVIPNSLIFAKVGAAIFLERKKIASNFLIDNNMMSFTPKGEISFFYYVFINLKLSKFAQIGALPSYNSSDLSTIKIKIPSLKEQAKIANFLSAIDEKINHCQGQIEKTQVWKKGLLQQLFV